MIPKDLVLASGNAGKLKELLPLCAAFHLKLKPQSSFQVPPVAETGHTFVENALIKARHCARAAGLPSLADDSGLIVPALGGQPGVRSARYAGENATDEANIEHLLNLLRHHHKVADRVAIFHCTLVLVQHPDDPDPLIAQGRWHGHIASSPCNAGGFGYDPVFFCNHHQVTAAELDVTTKNLVSHRGRALRELGAQLTQLSEYPSMVTTSPD